MHRARRHGRWGRSRPRPRPTRTSRTKRLRWPGAGPRLGEKPLGEWFRGWIATRGELAPSTRELYARLLERWIDTEAPVVGGSRPRIARLGAQSLSSVTPAAAREWDAAVLAEASPGRRAVVAGGLDAEAHQRSDPRVGTGQRACGRGDRQDAGRAA